MLVLSHALRRVISPVSLGRVCRQRGRRATLALSRGVLGGCCLVLAVSVGCLRSTERSDTIDVVRQPEVVAHCTLKTEGTYTAVGETNALTLAKNAAVEKGGNVFLIVLMTKRDPLTTEVHGKIYACKRTP